MKRYVYVVMGASGEYSDHREWPVAAYLIKRMAESLVDLCTQEYGVLLNAAGNRYHAIPKKANKYDPDMQPDFSGVNYYVVEVELRG